MNIIYPEAFKATVPRVQTKYNGGIDGVIVLPVVWFERAPGKVVKPGRQRRRMRGGSNAN